MSCDSCAALGAGGYELVYEYQVTVTDDGYHVAAPPVDELFQVEPGKRHY